MIFYGRNKCICRTNKDSIRINLFPNPIANAGSDTTIVYGYSLAPRTLEINILSPDFGYQSKYINLFDPQESIGYKLIGRTKMDAQIATLSSSLFLKVPWQCLMPPNGDGQNDFYGVFGLPIKDFKLSIYDRWGKSVAESSDIQQHWNGRQWVEQPIGTYIYVLSGSYEDETYY